ncbi:MAG TPA: acetyl-CoA hydrolase/transferase C-terminal domain-containing protein [Myxococcales bacterium]|nr:acetyl-CoA hydrolase/transferase C-terminal domain-containing protein [Myxococcales bacterium]
MQIVSAAEAVAGVRSGQSVFMHGGAATPHTLLAALVARARELRHVTLVHLHAEGPAPHLAPEMAPHFRHHALFIGGQARQAIAEGRAEYIPVFLSDIPRLFARGIIPLDVALLNVSAPDAHGFCSLGASVDISLQAARSAKMVVAQLNRSVPRTHGDAYISLEDIDFAVEVDEPPVTVKLPDPTPAEVAIAGHVAGLVEDGATLQLGIGSIPAAVASLLRGKRDLGIHTEMFTDAVVDLVERGVITGARKEINRGKIVSAFAMGTQRLYKFLHDNPQIEMRPTDYTNDTAVIRRFRRMVALNSAIEVDLTGQVCADSIGPRLYSGVGGQMDFIRGAALAEEGRAIIALPSTAQDGKLSRIVATLHPGAGVVTTRAHVQTIVTEHGVAELHGKSIAQRAHALIGLAAPQFREQLEIDARKLRFVG